MAIDWSKYSDEELAAAGPQGAMQAPPAPSSSGNISPIQPTDNPRITFAAPVVEPARGNLVFTGSNGVENLPGKVAVGNVENQIAADKQKVLMSGNVEEAKQTKEAQLIAARDVARKDFSSQLENFLTIDEGIPRGEGFHRWAKGISAYSQALGSDTEVGKFTNLHHSMGLALRVSLARLKDTGNLSEVEQKAAEQMIPGIFDDEEVAQIKRAYLKQLALPMSSGNVNLVKQVIDKFRKDKVFNQEQHTQETNSVDVNKYFTRKSSVGNFKL
jgi:hypothetical protein